MFGLRLGEILNNASNRAGPCARRSARHLYSASLLRVSVDCSQCAAPGEVMVPWNEPEVKNVTGLAKRSTVKLPWAPANRPVPPVMVLISVMLMRPEGKNSPDPRIVVKMLSPLAAIQ